MLQGTTPIDIFTLPCDTSTLIKIKVTYTQDDQVILTKTKDECELDGKQVKVKLTQEDTFKFDATKHYKVQIRAVTVKGDVVGSIPKTSAMVVCLDNEVL
jgi:hypothetical protein